MINVALWLVLALMWSSSFAAIKVAVETIDPMPLVATRMTIGACVMMAVLKLRGLSLSGDRQAWFSYTVTGLLGSVIPFLLISYGETHVDSGLAAILMGISPVWTVLMAHLFLSDESMTMRSAIGVCLGVSGVVLLVGPDALSEIGNHVIGQLCILLAAICYSTNTIFIKSRAKRPPMEMAAGSMLVGAICIIVLTLVFGEPASIEIPATPSLFAAVYLGLFPTALATLIYFYLVPHLGANRMSQVNFAVPVAGALIGVVALGETIEPSTGIALAVIMTAIYLVTSRKRIR